MKVLLTFVLIIASVLAWSQEQQRPIVNSLWLHFSFDRDKYVAGDTVFYSGYLNDFSTDGSTNQRYVIDVIAGNGVVRPVFERVLFIGNVTAGNFVIPSDTPPGIYSIIAFRETNSLEAEIPILFTADLYVAGPKVFHSNRRLSTLSLSPLVVITTDKPFYHTRDRVNIKLTQNDQAQKIRRILTVSVCYEKAILITDSLANESISDDRESVVQVQPGTPESNRNSLSFFKGIATYADSGKPVEDSTLLTFYLHNSDFFYHVYTNAKGEFNFPLFKFFGDEEVFFVADHRGKRRLNIVLKLTQNFPPITSSYTTSDQTDVFFEYAASCKAIRSSYDYYSPSISNEEEGDDDILNADYEVDMSKYESFATVEEIFSNIVSMVKYQVRDGIGSLRVFLKATANYAKEAPIFIVDGKMTENMSMILGMDPGLIQSIRIVRTKENLLRAGAIGKNGVIIITTRSRKFPIVRTPSTFDVKGITPVLAGIRKEKVMGVRHPSLEPVLYWNPNAEGTSFEFNTNDVAGTFVITITGVTDHGAIFTQRQQFQVEYKGKN
jgi:hypothetical protein